MINGYNLPGWWGSLFSTSTALYNYQGNLRRLKITCGNSLNQKGKLKYAGFVLVLRSKSYVAEFVAVLEHLRCFSNLIAGKESHKCVILKNLSSSLEFFSLGNNFNQLETKVYLFLVETILELIARRTKRE